MQLFRNTQESELFVPPKTIPRTRLEDGLGHEPRRNRDIQNDVILGLLGLFGFLLIVLVIGFS